MASTAACLAAQMLRQVEAAGSSHAAARLGSFPNNTSSLPRPAPKCDSIHAEAGRGNFSAVSQLLDSGAASVDERDSGGRTPLHFCAISGSRQLVMALLSRGAEADAADAQGKTPLHWAVAAGDVGVTDVLSGRADVNVNRAFCSGETSLHIAVYLEHRATLELLIRRGADCCCVDRQGRTPLHVAATVGNVGIIQRLLTEGCCGFGPDRSGRTALHCACAKGNAEAVTALVSGGANAEVYDKSGITPLYIAAFKGHKQCVQALLERHSASIEAIDLHRGSTALHAAAAMGHKEVVQLLLRRGANWQAKTKHGQRPIDMAVESNHTEVVQLLQLAPPPPRLARPGVKAPTARKRVTELTGGEDGLPGGGSPPTSLVTSPKKPRAQTHFPSQ